MNTQTDEHTRPTVKIRVPVVRPAPAPAPPPKAGT